MLHRTLTRKLVEAAGKMPVVTVIGPRQSGKTTLVKAVFPDLAYLSLEHPAERAAAKQDPEGLLSRFPDGVVIDEIQRAPDLLSYIQIDVDAHEKPGKFILTGSQNFLLMQSVSQTLAGRTAIFTLLPFSMSELNETVPIVPEKLTITSPTSKPKVKLWETIWTGFFPRIHDRNLDPQEWLSAYQRTYVERDLREVLNVMNIDGFDRFVRLCAARTGQELNLASIASDAGISQPTAKQWLTVLRISSLITVLPAHYENYRKRLRKRPKLHFLDTGLVCYLLGIHSPEVLYHHPLRGPIFESYVVSELTKAFVHRGKDAPLFHWRDATGHEIDVIIDLGDQLVPIEIKSGLSLATDTLKGLQWWTQLSGNDTNTGVLIHGGEAHHLREGFCIRPWWIA